ncbi:MAG: 4Fe-4S binding protein [Verrucomicrobia bacterium]|nr:4Fe-4S binding protein [Verrucomicrobiota bacterium]MBU4247239.1 4Fe-4S binding protein [Verrucomicrobiota bacterium]MBU4289955.1 4Fe-4S binding protein [Verrucomicrobiota bacterium]MBU4498050.1 4Fe-4S binding protein [Verrucomicrobiota bacterium]MCG2679697.1 4Fe-4S binding protein [Kiritimatiellia bacterium]
MNGLPDRMEEFLAGFFGNIKFVEKALLGLEGSYVELLTILSLGLLAVLPTIVPERRRQTWRRLNQIFGIVIFIYVVFTCLGVFGMVRNFFRGMNEIGRENIIALYYCSVPVTILVTSMLFGPAFCGWICPTGALQEFAGMLTRKWTLRRKLRGYPFGWGFLLTAGLVGVVFLLWVWRLAVTRTFFVEDSTIYWSEVLVLLLFILAFRMREWDLKLRRIRILSFWIIVLGALAGIRITSPVHLGFAKVYDPASLLSTVVVVVGALTIPNVWCRYLCPWRCAISWAARKSVRFIESDVSKCTKCGKCFEGCNVDAVKDGKINTEECHFCMKCVDACPTNVFTIKDDWRRK